MKTTLSSTFFGLLCLWSTPVTARILGGLSSWSGKDVSYDHYGSESSSKSSKKGSNKDGSEDQNGSFDQHGSVDYGNEKNGAMDYGFVTANDLWENGNGKYNCDNIFHGYWRDVNKMVFAECEYKWNSMLWPDKAHDCKYGAESFTMDMIGSCLETDDCFHLGIGAAASVAGSFCNRNGLFKEREWLPRKCRKHAATSCKCDAVNTIEDFRKGGVCNIIDGTALDYVDQIHLLCDREVEEMEEEAKLPWYYED